MKQKSSEFDQILQNYLNDSESFDLNKKQASQRCNVNSAQILFIDSPTFGRVNSHPGARPYSQHSAAPKKQELQISKRQLGPSAERALRVLEYHGALLNEAFTLNDLKSEWRKMAFKMHPDTTLDEYSSRDFALVLEAYQSLKLAFKPDQQAA